MFWVEMVQNLAEFNYESRPMVGKDVSGRPASLRTHEDKRCTMPEQIV